MALDGTSGNDELAGTSGDDTINGLAGNDWLVGKEGADSLDGGEGEDSLSGGTGDDTLTGGDGADLFTFDIGDGDDVITDFDATGAEPDLIELSGYDLSFASPADVLAAAAQDGADVLITLSGSDSIRLQGVQLADLDISHIRLLRDFDALTTADGQTLSFSGVDADGYSPTNIDLDVTLEADGVINVGPSIYGSRTGVTLTDGSVFENFGVIDGRLLGTANEANSLIGVRVNDGSFENHNAILLSGTDMMFGIVGSAINSGLIEITQITTPDTGDYNHICGIEGAIFNDNLVNAGTIILNATVIGAYGIVSGQAADATNTGDIFVTNVGDLEYGRAVGIKGDEEVFNSGGVTVLSSAGLAYGVYFENNARLTNDGVIDVQGAQAIGVRGASFIAHISNSGDIIVAATGVDAESVGISLGVSDGGIVTIENSGTITADIAIDTFVNVVPASSAARQITNSGDINGLILLGGGDDWIDNANGVINGDIDFGDGADSLDNSLGEINGVVDLAEGDDTAIGGAGADYFIGGWGADSLYGGGGADTLVGGSGADHIDGGAGDDTAVYSGLSIGVTVSLASGGSSDGDTLTGVENLIGSQFDDLLIGDAGNNMISGSDGDDTIAGGENADTLSGGDGVDIFLFETSAGDDVVSDFVLGEDKLDISAFGSVDGVADLAPVDVAGNAVLTLPDGSTITLLGVSALALSDGDFLLAGDLVNGTIASELLLGGAGDDTLNGLSGDDTLNGGGGRDQLFGGPGFDIADYSGTGAAVAVDLAAGAGTAGDAYGDTFDSIEGVQGGDFDDALFGDANANLLEGGAGADTISGGGGDDTLTGGAGPDVFAFDNSGGNTLITDFTVGEDILDLSSVDGVVSLADLSPTLSGGATVLTLPGGATISLANVAPADLGEQDIAVIPAALAYLFAPGETPWADLPDVGAAPVVDPIADVYLVTADYSVSAEEVIYSNTGLTHLFEGGGHGLWNFTNDGELWLQNDSDAALSSIRGNWSDFQNNGSIVVLSEYGNSTGFYSGGWGILQNNGFIAAISHSGDAVGYHTWHPSAASPNPSLNAGKVDVWSGAGSANGVMLENGGQFTNSGEVLVKGYDAATAFYSESGGDLHNSGLIEAVVGDGGASIGINMYWSGEFQFFNSGIIRADVAILVDLHYENIVTIYNDSSGLIDGAIWTDGSVDSVTNNGVIDGDIFFGSRNDYLDNSLGVITGRVDLGSGQDTVLGGAADEVFVGGTGADQIDGGGGSDTASYEGSASGVEVDLSSGLASGGDAAGDVLTEIENLIGSSLADLLAGDGASNVLEGGSGDDTLRGEDGNDQLYAGFGDDRAEGGAGDDIVRSGPGKDTLFGGEGNDTLGASNRSDLLRGEGGNDLMLGSNGNDRLFGGAGADTMLGGNGRDTLWGGAGADRLVGGNQVDTASYEEATSAVQVRLWAGDGLAGEALGDVLIEIENVFGSAFNDTLSGDDGVNRIDGKAGNDIVEGLGGADQLIGGRGADTLTGGAGDDTFLYFSGDGADTITDFVAGGASDDVIRLFNFGSSFDTFSEVMAAATQSGADTVLDFGGGQTITLEGVTKASLHADDFLFG